jgi:hypothetical protein
MSMGVYIKGMEMPDGCVVCPFFIENHHDRGDDSLCRASGKEAKCGCPLVPVPPHGRLIDVKSLENMQFTECMYDAESKLFVPFVEVASAIFDAPTVIPAEEGE